MRMMLAFFALACGLVAFAGDIGTLRNELESMFEADQSLRREIREVEERDGPILGTAEGMCGPSKPLWTRLTSRDCWK